VTGVAADAGRSDPSVATWSDAMLATALFAVDSGRLGGIVLRSRAGPVRDCWRAVLLDLLPAGAPVRRIPVNVSDDRLLGGLDLTATLTAGRPVAERGLLTEADGGIVELAMAERAAPGVAARLAAVLDDGVVAVERDGFATRTPARLGVVAFDEGIEADERPGAALLDRLAFHIDLSTVAVGDAAPPRFDRRAVAAAAAALASVRGDDKAIEILCGVAEALGVASLRAPILALRTAKARAALVGRTGTDDSDLAVAARLVLAPRATRLPVVESDSETAPESTPPPADADPGEMDAKALDRPLEDCVLEAAQAAVPADLLDRLRSEATARAMARSSGRSGVQHRSTLRGRPMPSRPGQPKGGARLDLIGTLRAAAPWQPVRRRALAGAMVGPAVLVHRDDMRVTRFRQRTGSTAVFAVDASGSAALHRLAEAKGAVERLLADCYVRRDQVALIAFRGAQAEVVLPPTRSLVRAKRCLAVLPGGGGTPLACGLDAAVALAEGIRRKGQTPTIVLLTDGRANVGRDGTGGRVRAEADALDAARRLRAAGVAAILVDVSPRPQPSGRALADAMAALYLPLPLADSAALSRAVRSAIPAA